jgi:hypothetical protein
MLLRGELLLTFSHRLPGLSCGMKWPQVKFVLTFRGRASRSNQGCHANKKGIRCRMPFGFLEDF